MRRLGEPFKQAERLSADGAVNVSVTGSQYYSITVTNDGKDESLLVSEFNASRLLAMLSFMLGVKIAPADAKRMRL